MNGVRESEFRGRKLHTFNCPKAGLEPFRLSTKVATPAIPPVWITTLKTQHTRAIRLVIAASAAAILSIVLAGNADSSRDHQPPDESGRLAMTHVVSASNSQFDFISIPEPGAWISLIGGGAVLVGIQRFRRRA